MPAPLMNARPLPPWAKPHPVVERAVLVDTDLAYPAILKELGVAENERTQYWLEVAYQIAKMDVQHAMGRFGTVMFEIYFRADDGRKDRWAINRFPDPDFRPGHPETAGVHKATKGKQARAHYKRLRGFVPG